jgi:phosphoenolpyruvate carboxylase
MAVAKDDFIKYLQNEINYLRAKVAKLEEENHLLKNALAEKVEENEPTYRELEESFDRLKKLVFETIRTLIIQYKRPLTNDEIIKAFKAKYTFQVKAETITRLVRKLKEEGYLFSPSKGYYMVSHASATDIKQKLNSPI